MDDRFEKALRALAGTSGGLFRAIAYAARAGEEGSIRRELAALLKKEALELDSLIVIETGTPEAAALDRPRFKAEVLGRLEGFRKAGWKKATALPVEGRGAPLRARERLSHLSASLPDVLQDVDRTLAGLRKTEPASEEIGLGPDAPTERPEPPAAPLPAPPDLRELTPLVLVPTFEDLGATAESVAQAVRTLVLLGVHVVIHEDGLDTRTREGRAHVRMAVRLGELRSRRAREKAVEDVARRREGLRVYGPVPFGFRREGKELVPVESELATVRRIRELARLEQNPVTIAVTLNREKRWWKDGTPWTRGRVGIVQKNPIYDRVLSEVRS